ncbi:type II secretion system F family protein [Planococcaceae bacterium Storch 2/2-2]|nr:type II secretion system F family protein [Planococcaceae bacterium Storch 2/2-2]
MAVFKYKGLAKTGGMKSGTINAKSEQEAKKKLRGQGINVQTIEQSDSKMAADIDLFTSVKTEDFVIYCRQFATLIQAGVTLVEATHILSKQTESKALGKALTKVEDDLRNGISLSKSAASQPKIFPPIFINMVRSGEATGDIDTTLERLATDMEKQMKIKKEVKSALTYPAVLFVMTILVSIFLMVSIVPQFVDIFNDLGAELPWITLFVLALSNSLTGYWWLWLLVLTIVIVGIVVAYKKSDKVRYYFSYATFKAPVFGELMQKYNLALFTRTFGTLVASSVPIVEALQISNKVLAQPIIGEVLDKAEKGLTQGERLEETLEESWLFPPLVTSMVGIGEKTGSLDQMLNKVADFYEDDVERTIATLKSLIEPLMIVLLAGIVGFIIAAIMIPMFSLYEQMS